MSGDDYDLTVMQVLGEDGFLLGEQLMHVHPASACEGRGSPCCIHSPSGHHMRTWPMRWRAGTRVMERICEHGTGHPDPDHLAYVISLSAYNGWQAAHPSCDGCCAPEGEPVSDSWYRDCPRAADDPQKQEVITRLLEVWKANPGLRLMQLLGNVFRRDAYYLEDYEVIARVEEYYSRDHTGKFADE
jgi:hypothetical protein